MGVTLGPVEADSVGMQEHRKASAFICSGFFYQKHFKEHLVSLYLVNVTTVNLSLFKVTLQLATVLWSGWIHSTNV